MEKEIYYAYCLTDWEGYFAENPRDRIDFICTEKVFDSYEDAYNEANKRLEERMREYMLKNGGDESSFFNCQDFKDVSPKCVESIKANEECYLKKLFNEDNEELCTIQIMKYQYERKKL